MEGRGALDRLRSPTSPTNGLAAPPTTSTEPPYPLSSPRAPSSRQSPLFVRAPAQAPESRREAPTALDQGSSGQRQSSSRQFQRGSGHGVRGCTAWSPRPRKPCAACSEFSNVRGSVSKAQQARKTRQRADHGGGCTHQWKAPHDRFRVLQALLMLVGNGATWAGSRPWWPPPATP